MKRFFVLAVAITLAACMGEISLSQTGGGGGASSGASGGSASGGAGAGASSSSGTSGTSGTAGAAGTSAAGGTTGAAGTSGTPGTAGSAGTAGTSGNVGASGSSRTAGSPTTSGTAGTSAGVGARAGVNAGGVGANTQAGSNFNFQGMGQNPFFSDPGVRQQLGLNNNQFNQLNRAYQQSLLRYNQNQSSQTRDNSGVTNTVGGQQARQQELQARSNAGATAGADQNTAGRDNTGVTNTVGGQQARQQELQAGVRAGTDTAGRDANGRSTVGRQQESAQNRNNRGVASQQQAATNQQDLANDGTDFNSALDATFTDPAMRQRFNQLNWQYQGVGAFSDPMVQQQLNMTPQQRQQLTRMAGEWSRDLQNLQRTNRGNLTQEQFNELRTRFANRMNRLMTAEQRQQWQQMVGQSYDFLYSAYSTINSTTANGTGTGATTSNGGTNIESPTEQPNNNAGRIAPLNGTNQATPQTNRTVR